MTIVGPTLTLNTGEGKIASMIFDSEFLYAGTATSPGMIVRIRRAGLSRVDAVNLELQSENNVAAMTHADGRIFAGLDTSPAKIVVFQGYLEPVDCILSDWTAWSQCSATCMGGKSTRTRKVQTQMRNGGAACSGELSQSIACADDIVCPEKCTGGRIWMAGTGTALEGGKPLTCTTASEGLKIVGTELSHCQCPQHKPYWHNDEFCTTAAICEKKVEDVCPARHLTCKIEAGALILKRHSKARIEDFHCRHISGNTNKCRCLCKLGPDAE